MKHLNDESVDLAITDLWYRLQIAILLGLGINLSTDANGMKLVEDAKYRFNVDEMSFVYDERGEYTSEHIKLLRVMSAQSPHVVAQIKNIGELINTVYNIGRIAHE